MLPSKFFPCGGLSVRYQYTLPRAETVLPSNWNFAARPTPMHKIDCPQQRVGLATTDTTLNFANPLSDRRSILLVLPDAAFLAFLQKRRFWPDPVSQLLPLSFGPRLASAACGEAKRQVLQLASLCDGILARRHGVPNEFVLPVVELRPNGTFSAGKTGRQDRQEQADNNEG
jgi:hypothetical protein